MNILQTECSMNWGGQEFRTLLEHDYLNQQQGFKSWIMCHPDSDFYKKANQYGINNLVGMDFSKSYNIIVATKILLFCIKHKVDIINSHGSKDSTLCLLAFLFRFPLIRSRQITSKIKKRTSYQYLCSHVIATAEAIKSLLVGSRVQANRITVIGEGVDLNEYSPDISSDYLREEFNLKASDIVICNIGMIRPDKGQAYYLESAKIILNRFDNVKFFLIGEGTGDKLLETKLRQMARDYQIADNFFITGYRNDVASFIHLADIVVIASTGVEAQSRIAPQAFATKRAVVSTNVGGLTELVKNEQNGLVVPAENSNAMAGAIVRLIENEEFRHALAENAYQFAKKSLSFEQMMGKIIRLYRNYYKFSKVCSKSGIKY